MLDWIVRATISTPRVDKLVLRIMVVWVLLIAARIAGQLMGGI